MINGFVMSKIDWMSKFEEFLIENNCYSEFVVRLLERSNRTLSEHIDITYYKELLIDCAFLWDELYWSDLSIKWTERVENILKNE